jgi:hypothetical protein
MLKNWKPGNPLMSGGTFVPPADDTYDLGSSTAEWKDLYVDGVAYIDTLRAEVLAIIGSGEGGVTAATGQTLRAPDVAAGGAGNVAGADLTIAAGLGTGIGDAGTVIFKLPKEAATGDNLQSLVTVLTMDMESSATLLTLTFPLASLFESTNGVTIGLAADAPAPDRSGVHIWKASAGSITAEAESILTIEHNVDMFVNFLTGNDKLAGFVFGDAQDANAGRFYYHNGNNTFYTYTAGVLELAHSAGAFAFQTNTTISSTGTLTIGNFTTASDITFAANRYILSATGPTTICQITDAGIVGLIGLRVQDTASIQTMIAANDWFSIRTYNTNDSAYKEAMRFENPDGASEGAMLSFYGATAIIRPTGVAISAAGIHAALVSLGLITA